MRRCTSRLIAAFGFVAFPYCIALGQWRPGEPEQDDLRRWRHLPLFWFALLGPWLAAGVAAGIVGWAVAYAALYAVALGIVALRLARRRTSAA